MTEEEIKAAKLEAYDKGYRAGSRRLAADRIERGTSEAYHAMWDKLFVAMLQIAHQRDWTVEGRLIDLRDERCKLAADWATAAMEARTLYRP